MRTCLSLALAALLAPTAACAGKPQLAFEREITLPVSELSGITLMSTAAGTDLLAVGDESYDLFVVPVVGDAPDLDRVRRIALPIPPRKGGSDFEGVAVDAAGTVWVLHEPGHLYGFALAAGDATAAPTLVREGPIHFASSHPLAAAWEADPKTRAEGLAWVGERLFIVKQKAPVALIELAWVDGRFEAGAHWPLPGLDDASELAVRTVGGVSELFVVGADSARLCAFPVPPARPVASAEPLPCSASWEMPKQLGSGKLQWEALAFFPDGRAFAGVDRKKATHANLGLLPILPSLAPGGAQPNAR